MITALCCVICCPLFLLKKGVSGLEEKDNKELLYEFEKQYGVTVEEALANIKVAFGTIAAEIKKVFKPVLEIWEEIKASIEQIEERYEHRKWSWTVVWDTRKKSQVMSNKPRFMVRKIIG